MSYKKTPSISHLNKLKALREFREKRDKRIQSLNNSLGHEGRKEFNRLLGKLNTYGHNI